MRVTVAMVCTRAFEKNSFQFNLFKKKRQGKWGKCVNEEVNVKKWNNFVGTMI